MTKRMQIVRDLILAVLIVGYQASSSMADTVTTSFEFNNSGQFSVGTPPLTATFSGGRAETQGNPSLYVSGLFAWHIAATATGTVTFETPPTEVDFFFRNVSSGGNSVARVFDVNGLEIQSFPGTASFSQIQVSRDAGEALIGRVEIQNNSNNGSDVVVDDFGFTAEVRSGLDDPIPATIPRGGITVRLTEIASGLTAPNWGIASPVDASRLFVVDQPGIIWGIDLNTNNRSVFLDLRDRVVELGIAGPGTFDERGLLGLAFHPDYGSNGLFYTYSSEPVERTADFSTIPAGETAQHQSVIREWRVLAPTNPASRPSAANMREILRIDQPQFNHNGGALNFDSNGYLYIALGDGGSADDQGVGHGTTGNGQNLGNPLGALLRIDPLGDNAANGLYGIPANNPFLGQGGVVEEIYAYGFRNPFRFSFDSLTGALWLADVGQNDIEEIDIVNAGGNYGWNFKEGSFFFDPNGDDDGFVTDINPGVPAGLIDPVAEYDHDEGIAVIGGFVYRGMQIGALQGRYVFGDNLGNREGTNGRLFYLTPGNTIHELNIWGKNDSGISLNGFGQDADGALYALGNETGTPSGSTGRVLRIDPVVVATATVETGILNIPIVNVAGEQGAFNVNFALAGTAPLELVFAGAATTSMATNAPATFSFATGILRIPMVELIRNEQVIGRFAVELAQIPGSKRIRLTEAVAL